MKTATQKPKNLEPVNFVLRDQLEHFPTFRIIPDPGFQRETCSSDRSAECRASQAYVYVSFGFLFLKFHTTLNGALVTFRLRWNGKLEQQANFSSCSETKSPKSLSDRSLPELLLPVLRSPLLNMHLLLFLLKFPNSRKFLAYRNMADA